MHPLARFLARFDRGALRLGRVEAFSDGVFAIVVTLLVLELKVPALADGASPPALGHALVELGPKLLSWLISFVIVCKFWLNHHHLLAQARAADYGMIWLNSLFLMLQSFIPFPTALLGEYSSNPLAASVFGLVMALNTVAFIALRARIERRLLRPELAAAVDPRGLRKAWIGPASYAVGAALAWIAVPAAFVAYLLTPLFYIVPAPLRGEPDASTAAGAAD